MGRGGPVSWPVRSTNLSYLDFHSLGDKKTLVYDNSIDKEELVAKIAVAAGEIRDMPRVCEIVRISMHI